MRPAVFLDRDGTINYDPGYTVEVEGFRLLEGAQAALRDLKRAGYLLLVVSNQSGIGRGYYDTSRVERLHQHLNELLGEAARIDAFYYASYAPGQDADIDAVRMRKPDTGMFEAACRDRPIDVGRSWMVGDRPSDVEFGQRAGLRTILVGTGAPPDPTVISVPSLREAAAVILRSV
jgi:D-glycero-D-manno-heptose 1,7-bisphosphate phosphatase